MSMKTKTRSGRTLDVIHSGMVLLSDGKGHGKPARLVLTKEILTIQIPTNDEEIPGNASIPVQPTSIPPSSDNIIDTSIRIVTIEKGKEGLGLSIKGGTDQNVPVIVSKILPGLPASNTGQIYVGDKILEVNGTSITGLTHEEVVKLLIEGTTITLTLQQESNISSTLYRRSPSKRLSESTENSFIIKGALKSPSIDKYNAKISSLSNDNELSSSSWKILHRLPLPMAIITRYLWGTDKIRSNAFELRTVDDKRSGIIHCEDDKALEQWVKYIGQHIEALNKKSIKMSNKYLHPSEYITYIGWIEEKMSDGYFEDPKLKYEQRFLILKGSDLCIFEQPPLNSDELEKCISMYKIYETALRTNIKRKDRRPYVCVIESYQGQSHYISVQSVHQLQQLEAAYYNSIYRSVTTVQTRTFACSFDGRPAGLVIDIKQGISLYDIPTKKYIWQYDFDSLISSSDDSKMRLELIFRNNDNNKNESKEMECDQVLSIVYTLHSFYITLMMGIDPEYLKANPLD